MQSNREIPQNSGSLPCWNFGPDDNQKHYANSDSLAKRLRLADGVNSLFYYLAYQPIAT
jgi:hypothetical protein